MVGLPVFYLPPNPGQTFNSNLYFLVIHDDTILPYIFLTSGSKSLQKLKKKKTKTFICDNTEEICSKIGLGASKNDIFYFYFKMLSPWEN